MFGRERLPIGSTAGTGTSAVAGTPTLSGEPGVKYAGRDAAPAWAV